MTQDDSLLAILSPIPLQDGAGVPFYDGQPRRKDGRFDFMVRGEGAGARPERLGVRREEGAVRRADGGEVPGRDDQTAGA